MIAALASSVTAELRFTAACSYVPRSARGFARQGQQLVHSLRSAPDPTALWAGIQRHRIFASAERVLREHAMQHVLGDCHPELQARARQSRLQNVRLLSSASYVSALLSAAAVDHRFLKGPFLSQKIYGDAGLRHSADLDVLVMPQQLASALAVLHANGWQFSGETMWVKGGIYRRLAECRRREFELFHKEKGIRLELHWRIETARCPSLEQKWRTLWQDQLIEPNHAESLHLCLHGAAHAWNRLKWLGDLAAILDRQPELWRASQGASAALDLELIVAQAVLLLQLLYGIEPDASAARILHRNPQAYALAAFSLAEMKQPDVAHKRSAREIWTHRQYAAAFEVRYSTFDRFVYRLGLWLFHDSQMLRDHPVFLAGMPLVRAVSLFNRYVLKGDSRL